MSPDRGAVTASPRTERSMARLRKVVYATVGVIVVGAIISGTANIYFMSQLREQGAHIEGLAQTAIDQNATLEKLLDSDAEDRATRVERLNDALAKVQEQFVINDEASARRHEQLRDELLSALRAIDCAPGNPAPAPPKDLPPLFRRAALPPVPLPPLPVQTEQSSPVIVEVEPPCTLNLLGICVDV